MARKKEELKSTTEILAELSNESKKEEQALSKDTMAILAKLDELLQAMKEVKLVIKNGGFEWN